MLLPPGAVEQWLVQAGGGRGGGGGGSFEPSEGGGSGKGALVAGRSKDASCWGICWYVSNRPPVSPGGVPITGALKAGGRGGLEQGLQRAPPPSHCASPFSPQPRSRRWRGMKCPLLHVFGVR